ncbi:AP2 domain-containing protein, partial [Bacillus cereus]
QLATEKIKRTIEHNRKNVFVEKTSLNALTSKVPSDNTSGVKGVCPVKKNGKWKAYITINKKNINLGIFTEKEDAIAARKKAEEKYHKPILEKYGITEQNR